MKKTKNNKHILEKSQNLRRRILTASVLSLSVFGTLVGYFNLPALADWYDEQIKALRRQNEAYEAKAEQLKVYANSLHEEIARLDADKQVILGQIDETNKQLDKLASEIKQTEKEIEDNQEALGILLKEIYLASQITPLERLASSKTITDYINEETQRDSMRRSLVTKVDEIEAHKKQLEEKKKESEQVLAKQQVQRDEVLAKEAEKNKILAETQGQEDNYRALAEKNNNKVRELEQQQAEEMRRQAAQSGFNVPTGVLGGGGYPGKWAYAPLNAYTDPWGLYTRQCVSYAAWKVWSTGRFVPHFGGMGNANQWPATTARHGIPNGTTPKEGSVAVWYVGQYGHVMYVEKVNGDGTMWVSDYNWNWDGAYHYYRRSTAGLTYIYF